MSAPCKDHKQWTRKEAEAILAQCDEVEQSIMELRRKAEEVIDNDPGGNVVRFPYEKNDN